MIKLIAILLAGLVLMGCFLRPGWGIRERNQYEIEDFVKLYLLLGAPDVDISKDNIAFNMANRFTSCGYKFQAFRIKEISRECGTSGKLILNGEMLVPYYINGEFRIKYANGSNFYPSDLSSSDHNYP